MTPRVLDPETFDDFVSNNEVAVVGFIGEGGADAAGFLPLPDRPFPRPLQLLLFSAGIVARFPQHVFLHLAIAQALQEPLQCLAGLARMPGQVNVR